MKLEGRSIKELFRDSQWVTLDYKHTEHGILVKLATHSNRAATRLKSYWACQKKDHAAFIELGSGSNLCNDSVSWIKRDIQYSFCPWIIFHTYLCSAICSGYINQPAHQPVFLVILHTSCSRQFIWDTLPLSLCRSPDSRGEILVIFQSAAALMGFLSRRLKCAVMWSSHYSCGKTLGNDTFITSRCQILQFWNTNKSKKNNGNWWDCRPRNRGSSSS